jgi:Acetyltransferase (GNAT) domain
MEGSAIPPKLTCRFEAPTAGDWSCLRRRIAPEWGFLATDWAGAWVESYLPYDRWRAPLRHLTVRNSDGVPVGVFPLVTLQFGPLGFDAAAGYFLPYRSLPLTGDEEAMVGTCTAMISVLTGHRRSRLGLRIGPTSTKDQMSDALVSALRRCRWSVGTRTLGNIFAIELPETMLKFERMCSDIHQRAKYYERRLQKMAELRIVQYGAGGRCNWEKVMGEVAMIEQNSWVANGRGTLVFSSPAARNFWIRMLCDKFLSSCVTVWLMYIDGRPASFSFGLDVARAKYTLANLYDEAYRAFSCGNILARHVLAGAIERGQRFVDWGQGDSGYKQRWGARSAHALRDVVALPPRPAGVIVKTLLGRAGYVFS